MAASSFCPMCGSEFVAGARFCSACGTAIAAPLGVGGQNASDRTSDRAADRQATERPATEQAASGWGSNSLGSGAAGKVRLVRPRSPRMVAGVCSGIAILYGWDVSVVRILYAVFVCLSVGLGLLVYALAWVVIPDAQYALPAQMQRRGNVV